MKKRVKDVYNETTITAYCITDYVVICLLGEPIIEYSITTELIRCVSDKMRFCQYDETNKDISTLIKHIVTNYLDEIVAMRIGV